MSEISAGRRARRLLPVILALVVAVWLALRLGSGRTPSEHRSLTAQPPPSAVVDPPANSSATPVFGVLDADPTHLAADRAAGVRQVTLNVGWNLWEPSPGVFSSTYRSHLQAVAARYRRAGMAVAVDPGLQYAPRWTKKLPNAKVIAQNGSTISTLDFAWSAAVRRAAGSYLKNLVSTLGPVTDYRVGLSENGEALYPDTSTNQWWAFTPSAQGTAGGLPAGLSPSPMPGWIPGSPTWRGQNVTVAQATSWYDWYFSGSVSALSWEIATYRAAGYSGQVELVMPGTGALPTFYNQRLTNLLAGGSQHGGGSTMNTAAVWWKLLDALPNLTNVAVDISSVDDGSGTPRANGCTTTDTSAPLTSQTTWSWSDTRWLTYLATLHHLPVLGENPGNTPASQLPNIMNLVNACHLQTLQWAFDDQLHGDGSTASADQVAHAVGAAPDQGGNHG